MKVQLECFQQALTEGMPRLGWKVGINVPEILGHLKLSHSGIGWLHGDRVFQDGATIEIPDGADLKLEPELAIHIGEGVTAGEDAASALGKIRGVSPAFEIVDYAQPRDGLDTIIGHAMFHYGCVFGEVQGLSAISEMGSRWPQFEVDGVECPAPREDLVPEDLGGLVCFVAQFLNEFGESLEAGDVIMSGSYTATAVDLVRGSNVRANFGELGSLSIAG